MSLLWRRHISFPPFSSSITAAPGLKGGPEKCSSVLLLHEQNCQLLTHSGPSLLGHWKIKTIHLSNKRSDVFLALGVTQGVSDLWKCHHIDFIQRFIHHLFIGRKAFCIQHQVVEIYYGNTTSSELEIVTSISQWSNAFLLIHICSGSHLLFLTGSHQVNTWERAWENIFLSFLEDERKCIIHGKVHST